MMEKHGIYVQDINYPTVPRGQEMIRIAPTPHHTDEMKEAFLYAITDVWEELGLAFAKKHVPIAACSKFSLNIPQPLAIQA